jgi:hypothetical protein
VSPGWCAGSKSSQITERLSVSMRLVQRSVFLELLGREPMAVEGLLRTLA